MITFEKIDILIPVYNCEKYIKKCIESLLNQTYKNISIIIADDGSTDNSLNIINQISKNNNNIIIYSKENENNISKTRNFLLEKINNNYFTFFDADDYAEPNYIEELIHNLIIYNADISMCGKIRHKEHKNKKASLSHLKPHKIYFFNSDESLIETLSSNLYNGTVYCKLFKRSLLNDIKFDENIHYGEDLDFVFKIFKNSSKLVFSNKKLYHYIIRKNSIVTSKFKINKLTCIDCYDNIINNLNHKPNIQIYAKAMQGLIAIEILYYMWRDRFKNKIEKQKLKNIIKNSIPFIKQSNRLSLILKLSPLVIWLTKFM